MKEQLIEQLKYMIIKTGFLTLTFLAVFLQLSAEEDFLLGTKYGISSYYNYNLQAVDMRQLPSVSDSIPRSALGNSYGWAIGAFYEYRFTNRTSLFFRGLFTHHKAEINGVLPENILDIGILSNHPINHTINSDLSNIKLEALVRYRLFKEFSLFAGLNSGIRFSNLLEHSKSLQDEPNLTFTDGSKLITGLDKDFGSKFGIQAALVVGFGYDIPVNYNGQYLITPEILFETGYSDLGSNLTWDINSLRLGVSFKYSLNPTVKYEIKEIFRHRDTSNVINIAIDNLDKEYITKGNTFITYDTTVSNHDLIITKVFNRTDTLFFAKKSKIVENSLTKRESINNKIKKDCLKLYSLGSDAQREFPKTEIYAEEFLSTSIKPLLNYIFFDENSFVIPSRYELLNTSKANRFKIEDLRIATTLETYYHLLNIIGKRLIIHPEAKITFKGYNSSANSEKDNMELSKRRAMAVKEYLEKVWNVSSERMDVKYSDLPEKPSNPSDPDGLEENRRVEIISDTPEILAPVIINDTLLEVTPAQIRFYNNANSCYNVTKWSLEVMQSATTLIIFRGEYKIPERLIWRLSEQIQTLPKNSEPVTYRLTINDYSGEKIISQTDTIHVQRKTVSEKFVRAGGDKRIDKYSLILFDFDKAELNFANERIMNYINSQIKPNSKVFIEGYTDRMGNDEYNLNLSNKRAANVASKITKTKNISYKGLGESELIYNNELPEGRFYCRTVNITVETEIEK